MVGFYQGEGPNLVEIMEINGKELHPFVYQKLKSKSSHGIKI
jgi:hypothetical protein